MKDESEANRSHGERGIRLIIDEYGKIMLFAAVLTGCVIASYYFSRSIPVDLFVNTISPIMHIVIMLVTLTGAILLYGHLYDLRARKTWQVVLFIWTFIEAAMLVTEKVFGYSTIIFGVDMITRRDLVVRDLLACLLLFYPMEVLFPKWLKVHRMLILMAIPYLIWGADQIVGEDLRSLLLVYPLLLAIYLLTNIQNYRKICEENYSSLENTAIRWLRLYLVTLIIIGISYFYQCFSGHPTRFFTQQWLVLFLLLMNTGQILFRRKPWQEANLPEELEAEEQDERSSFPPEYRAKFEQWMAEEKPYLNKDFRLTDMTQVLPLNRTYLSQFIKEEYRCNFYQLVTTYRINEAKRLMTEFPKMKMTDIADRSGFASLVVFCRVFKRETDMTPTEWKGE